MDRQHPATLNPQYGGLTALSQTAGLTLIGGTDLFCLTRQGNAPALYDTLLSHGILVRKFPERPSELRFGLPRDADHFQRLKEALHD